MKCPWCRRRILPEEARETMGGKLVCSGCLAHSKADKVKRKKK